MKLPGGADGVILHVPSRPGSQCSAGHPAGP